MVKGKILAYIGDGNNMTHSLLLSGMTVRICSPAAYAPEAKMLAQQSGGQIEQYTDLAGADVIQ